MADQSHSFERRLVVSQPIVKQLIKHWVQFLVWRIPGLEQVVVEPDRIYGPNSYLDVCVGGQENALGVREQLNGLLEQLDTGHPRHAVIGQQQSCLISTQFEFTQRLKGRGTGLSL